MASKKIRTSKIKNINNYEARSRGLVVKAKAHNQEIVGSNPDTAEETINMSHSFGSIMLP
jgi:hypothetical protein